MNLYPDCDAGVVPSRRSAHGSPWLPNRCRRLVVCTALSVLCAGLGGDSVSAQTPSPEPTPPTIPTTMDGAIQEAPAADVPRPPRFDVIRQARQTGISGIRLLRGGKAKQAQAELAVAVEGWPNHSQLVFALARAEASLGLGAEALERVRGLIGRGYAAPFVDDPAFAEWRDDPVFVQAVDELAALQEQTVGRSETVFTLAERQLVPEAVVFDPIGESFFVSSVHLRKILRRDREGRVTEFAVDDLWAVSGLAVDASGRRLWAATSALPNMRDASAEEEGKTALVAFDLDSGEEVLRFESRVPGHRLADLTVDGEGRVYVSDGNVGIWRTVQASEVRQVQEGDPVPEPVWQRRPADSSEESATSDTWQAPADLEVISPAGFFRSPQGLSWTADGSHLLAADYSYGIAAMAPTGEWFYLDEPEGVSLTGIDGLNVLGHRLLAIQNGARPQRILRLQLELPTRRVLQSEIVAMNLPQWSEPTLGTVVDGDFVYVGNSQWDRFDGEGKLPPVDELAEPVILRLDLTSTTTPKGKATP